MKTRTRRVLTALTAGVLVASIVGLVFLRSGRPVYYTDGEREIAANQLVHASMVVWDRPEPEFELPGPVQGRVETLPDGRLLYGRLTPTGTSDLVLFDPARPGIPPEPVLVLNSPGHEVAPTLAADGTLYFSSDRRGGQGFDLYAAQLSAGGTFRNVTRLPDWINSGFDETDPAPDPWSDRIVFVRRDPEVRDGANGRLMVGRIGVDEAPVPLYEPEKNVVPLDRDPAFSADGVSLWFVRQELGSPPVLMRTWRLGDVFAPPRQHEGLLVGGPFRSPDPDPRGFAVRLVVPGSSAEPETRALVYSLRAREVFPWWAGQAELELFLFVLAILCVVLLLLLLLGHIWRQLDVITWCLLISLFLHVLVLMLITDVEIVRKFVPFVPTEGRFEVELVSGLEAAAASGDVEATPGPQLRDPYAELRFAGHSEQLDAAAPAAAPAQDVPEQELAKGERGAEELPDAAVTEVALSVADAAEVELIAGVDAAVEVAEATSEAAAQAAAPELAAAPAANASEVLGADAVRVVVPGTGPATQPRDVRQRARSVAVLDRAGPQPGDVDASPSAVKDTAAPAAPRVADDRAALVAAATPRPAAGNARAQELSPSAPSRAATDASGAPQAAAEVLPVGSLLAASARRVSPAAATATPVGEVAAARGAAAPAQTSLRDEVAADLTAAVPATATEAAPGLRALELAGAVAGGAAARADLGPRRRAAAAIGSPRDARIEVPDAALDRAARSDVPDGSGSPAQSALPTASARRPAPTEGLALADAPTAAPPPQPDAGAGPVTGPAVDVAAVAEIAPAATPSYGGGARPRSAASAARGIEPPAVELPRPRARGLDLQAGVRAGASIATLSGVNPRVALRDVYNETRFDGGAAPPRRDPTRRGARARASAPVQAVAAPLPLAASGPRRLERRRVATGGGGLMRAFVAPGSLLARAPRAAATPSAPPALAGAVAEPSLFQNRFGSLKTAALQRFGGTEETERAVQAGLDYLARIQNRDGSWGDRRHRDEKYGEVYVGKTALCLLAFLGAGHTPTSTTEYSEVAARAVTRLLATQDLDSGHFGTSSSYSHGITTYALAECYGLTTDPRLRGPVEAAVQWIQANQSRSRDPRNAGGWGYYSDQLAPEDRFSRTSVTAWMVMALESAKLSGFEVSTRALAAARAFLEFSWDESYGHFRYNHRPQRLRSDWPTLPASTPASVFALLLLGHPADEVSIKTGLEYTLSRRPQEYGRASRNAFVLRAAGNVYFWYYGSLACFLAGGDVWEEWNEALKRVLPAAQNADGSFEPIDPYADIAHDTSRDKSYTTAMCVLSLEVYYRYFTPLLEKR